MSKLKEYNIIACTKLSPKTQIWSYQNITREFATKSNLIIKGTILLLFGWMEREIKKCLEKKNYDNERSIEKLYFYIWDRSMHHS